MAPAAIAIPAIIGAAGAGAQLVGAKVASNASKNAAKTQSSAADHALAVQQQQYQQSRQDFAPYQAAGQQAIGRLGQMSQQAPMTFDPNQPQGMPRMNPQQPQSMPMQSQPPMGQLGAPQSPPSMAQAGQQGQQEPMVLLGPPPGQPGAPRQVPASKAQQLIAQGAVRL
jgi:hypothetical protein